MLDIFGLTDSPRYTSVAFALPPQDQSTHGTIIAKVRWKEGGISKWSRWPGSWWIGLVP